MDLVEFTEGLGNVVLYVVIVVDDGSLEVEPNRYCRGNTLLRSKTPIDRWWNSSLSNDFVVP